MRREAAQLVHDCNRQVAREAISPPGGRLDNRVHAAARLVRSFGGLTDVRATDGILVIRSKACPLAALTSEHPAACKVLEALLAEYVSARVKTCCRRDEEPQCCFEISR